VQNPLELGHAHEVEVLSGHLLLRWLKLVFEPVKRKGAEKVQVPLPSMVPPTCSPKPDDAEQDLGSELIRMGPPPGVVPLKPPETP
jgi:hypothetical protein